MKASRCGTISSRALKARLAGTASRHSSRVAAVVMRVPRTPGWMACSCALAGVARSMRSSRPRPSLLAALSNQISSASTARQAMNTNQPSKACSTPSAISMPQYSTVTPIMPMRKLFISTVTGMVARKISQLCQRGPRYNTAIRKPKLISGNK